MQFFYNFSDALFAFMQRGGDVLYLIGLLAFVMWFLIFERMWYFFFTHRNHLGKSVQEWDSRQDKSSWNSKAIRDMLIAQNEIRIDQNLGLIKMCVGIAPLFGLFGTITGMINTFQAITLFGTGDPKTMANGISEALVTTMLGLMTAIPATFMAAIMANYAKNILTVLEEQSTGMVAAASEENKA